MQVQQGLVYCRLGLWGIAFYQFFGALYHANGLVLLVSLLLIAPYFYFALLSATRSKRAFSLTFLFYSASMILANGLNPASLFIDVPCSLIIIAVLLAGRYYADRFERIDSAWHRLRDKSN